MTAILDGGPKIGTNKSGFYELKSAEKGADGKWRTRTQSLGTRDYAEAVRRRAEILSKQDALDAADAEVQALGRVPTIEELAAKYLADRERRGLGMGEAYMLRPMLRRLGAMRPATLTDDVIASYMAQRVCSYTTGRTKVRVRPAGAPVKSSTLRRELTTLRAVLNWSVAKRHLRREDYVQISLPAAVTEKPRGFLDEREEAVLWGHAVAHLDDQDPKMQATARFVLLGLGTGARSGALRALTWDRVDLRGGIIDFRVPGERLTRKRKVATPINGRLRPVLERMHMERPAGDDHRKLVCFLSDTDVDRVATRFMRRAMGTPDMTAHWLRHTFITLSLRAGVSVWDAAGLVGTSPVMVEKVYGHHASDSHMRKAADKRFA